MTPERVTVRSLEPADWPRVQAIYASGIASGRATFESSVPDWTTWNSSHLPQCRLIACVGGEIAGWAALSRVSARGCYAGVAEVSVYVAEAVQGQGVGRTLLTALVDASEQNGFWTVQASIFAINEASLRLHARCGFREVGRRERIAQRSGVWVDTVLMERRSPVVGV